MIQCTKKGYLTLEAAIFLPIFIIGIATLGYVLKLFSTAENITYSTLDETSHLAAQAYGIKYAPFFPVETEARLRKENSQAEKIDVTNFRYLYREGQRDGIISLDFKYRINIRLPLNLYDSLESQSRIKCRGFIGKSSRGEPMPFEEMEKNGDSQIVWIFPMWGKNFHGENCTYVKSHARQMVLTAQIKKRFQPCELCKPESLITGSYVYCFFNTGHAYHRGNCKMIDKYTIEIEKEDALAKGYKACSKCKGG